MAECAVFPSLQRRVLYARRGLPPSFDPVPDTAKPAESPSTDQALLLSGLRALQLPDASAPKLLAFLDELAKWNKAYNLTSVRETQGMVTRHLLDSLAVLPHVRGPLLDVGSGAGLPAIPLAIADPALAITALDSNGKKVRFIRHARRTLGLDNLDVVESRVTEFKPDTLFAAIVSRAFSALGDFVESTGHLLAADGRWLAMKGKVDDAELKNLPAGIVVEAIKPLQVPGLAEARHLIIVARV